MGNVALKSEVVVRNDAGDLEVIDLYTGEVIVNSTNPVANPHEYMFDYKTALLICQEIRAGKTMEEISRNPQFPPLCVINHWQRVDRMFAQEMIIARKERGDHYHDKVMEIAKNAASLAYSKDEVPSAKLGSDLYRWGAERANPDKYGNKVTHEGSETKPILMRVVNTGINRAKPEIVEAVITSPQTEVINGNGTRDVGTIDSGAKEKISASKKGSSTSGDATSIKAGSKASGASKDKANKSSPSE